MVQLERWRGQKLIHYWSDVHFEIDGVVWWDLDNWTASLDVIQKLSIFLQHWFELRQEVLDVEIFGQVVLVLLYVIVTLKPQVSSQNPFLFQDGLAFSFLRCKVLYRYLLLFLHFYRVSNLSNWNWLIIVNLNWLQQWVHQRISTPHREASINKFS